MSAQQISIVGPILLVLIVVGSMMMGVYLAKRRASEWKKHTTFFFFYSTGMGGRRRRATKIWMRKLGYAENDALVLATYQSAAILSAFVGFILMIVIMNEIKAP